MSLMESGRGKLRTDGELMGSGWGTDEKLMEN